MIMALPLTLLLLLLPSACTAAVETSDQKASQSILSQKHIRGHPTTTIRRRRRVQTTNTNNNAVVTTTAAEGEEEEDDESYLPDGEIEEWYLPTLKVDVKKTWLFGAGDPADWGGSVVVSEEVADNGNATTNSTTATTPATTPVETKYTTPTPINVTTLLRAGEYITSISAGGLHSAILTNEGRILTAGGALAGRGLGRSTNNGTLLGFSPVVEVYHPNSRVGEGTITRDVPKFVKVVTSQYYTFALDDKGDVWSTGNNVYGQLCLNDTVQRDRFHRVTIPNNGDDDDDDENLVDQEGKKKIVDIILGARHTFMLREDGKVWGCGWNQYGQLGIGLRGQNVLSPVEVMIDAPDNTNGNTTVNHEVITNVVAGRGSSYFMTSSGHVYSTGTNYKGQLCLGHRDDRTLPAMLTGNFRTDGVVVESIAAGASSFYMLLSNGIVLACGENLQGQLGIGSDVADSIDVPTTIANVTNVTAVFSGPTSFGAYFVSDRVIYEVGFDGVGARENWKVPTMMACSNEETTLKKGVVISSGNDHTLYLATVETTFDCEGGSNETMSSLSPSSTVQPSQSSKPTMASPPSSSPTVSLSPTSSPPPSSTTGAPTAPVTSAAPTTSPVAPTRGISPGNGNGASECAVSIVTLLGISLSFMWQWL